MAERITKWTIALFLPLAFLAVIYDGLTPDDHGLIASEDGPDE